MSVLLPSLFRATARNTIFLFFIIFIFYFPLLSAGQNTVQTKDPIINKLISEGYLKTEADGTFKKNEALTRAEAADAIMKLLLDIRKNRKTLEQLSETTLTAADIAVLNQLITRYENDMEKFNRQDTAQENRITSLEESLQSLVQSEENRIKLNGEIQLRLENITHVNDQEGNNFQSEERIRLGAAIPLARKASAFLRLEQKYRWGNKAAGYTTSVFDPRETHTANDPPAADRFNDQNLNFKEAYIDVRNFTKYDIKFRLGRQFVKFGHGLFFAEDLDGMKFDFNIKDVDLGIYTFDTDNIFDGRFNNYKYDGKGNRAYLYESDTDGLNFIGLKFNTAFANRHFLEIYRVRESISKYSQSKAYERITGIQIDDPSVPTTYAPVWTGICLDGKLGNRIDYNLEYVKLESNIGNFIETYTRFGLWDTSWTFELKPVAWLGAFQFTLDRRNKFLFQYGSGDEEFLAYGIDYDYRLNNMRGNWNPGNEPFCSFSGVKDALFRFSHQFSDRYRGYLQYENVIHADTSNIVDNAEDYKLLIINNTFDYGRNHVSLDYEHLRYDDPIANNQPETRELSTNFRTYHTYGGGRDIFKLTYTLEF